MKKLFFILMAAMLLAACGNKEDNTEMKPSEKVEQKEMEREVLSEREHNIEIFDNEDITLTLLNSEHVRLTDYEDKDIVFVNFKVVNKKNRTFDFLIEEMKFDGSSEKYDIGLMESELEPEDELILETNYASNILNDDKTIKFGEHIAGQILYTDYEGNRNVISFNEYIND